MFKKKRKFIYFLKNNFIDKNKILCNETIKIHAKNKFNKLYSEKVFEASDGCCDMFNKRWNLSTVKVSISKIATKVYAEDKIKLFLKECKDSMLEIGKNFFLI